MRRVAIVGLVGWFLLSATVALSEAAGAATPSRGGPLIKSVGSGGTSTNWSGFVETGRGLTSVSGSWTEPSALCAKKVTQSAFWVGLDGASSKDNAVEQIGTDADCIKGKKVDVASYYAWYELYPGATMALSTSSNPVAPGDVLQGSVVNVGGAYTLVLVDVGKWTYSTTLASTGSPTGASAEWVAEAPLACVGTTCKPVLLTDFGTAYFTAAMANGLPIGGVGTAAAITMTKGSKTVLAAPSSLSGLGTAFSVTWIS